MREIFILLFFIFPLFAGTSYENTIKKMLEDRFIQTYPTMQIENIKLKSASSLIKKFSDFSVTAISITKDNLKRSKGSILVTFKKAGKQRKLYFRYTIKATILLYKTTTPLKSGREITPDIASLQRIPFTTLYDKPINDNDFYKYIAKTNIKEDSVLSMRYLKKLTDIKRNDTVTAVIRDGGLSLEFSVKALGEGDIGDIIKVKKDHKKIFKAKIISKNRVEIIN